MYAATKLKLDWISASRPWDRESRMIVIWRCRYRMET